jgi:hypothetical protein
MATLREWAPVKYLRAPPQSVLAGTGGTIGSGSGSGSGNVSSASLQSSACDNGSDDDDTDDNRVDIDPIAHSNAADCSGATAQSADFEDWPLFAHHYSPAQHSAFQRNSSGNSSSSHRPLPFHLQYSFDLLWSWGQPRVSHSALLFTQRVNHFPDSRQLTRKDCLHAHVRRMRAMGPRMKQVCALTYTHTFCFVTNQNICFYRFPESKLLQCWCFWSVVCLSTSYVSLVTYRHNFHRDRLYP